MSFLEGFNEGSFSTNLPADANVAWNRDFSEYVRKKALSIYDGGVIEIPPYNDLSGVMDSFYKMKEAITEKQNLNPSRAEKYGSLLDLVEYCIDSAIKDEGFDFKTAWGTVKQSLDRLEEKTEKLKEAKNGLSKALTLITARYTCPYCYYPISRYPGTENLRCPSCGNHLKPSFYDSKTGSPLNTEQLLSLKKSSPAALKEGIKNIRVEVQKRDALYKNLAKMSEGKLDRLTSLKAALSCLTRVVIEEETQNYGGDILKEVGEPLLMDICALFLDEQAGIAQKRVGEYFAKKEEVK